MLIRICAWGNKVIQRAEGTSQVKEFPQSPTNGTNDLINIEINADFPHTWPLSSFAKKFRKALHSFRLDFSYLCQCAAAGVPYSWLSINQNIRQVHHLSPFACAGLGLFYCHEQSHHLIPVYTQGSNLQMRTQVISPHSFLKHQNIFFTARSKQLGHVFWWF